MTRDERRPRAVVLPHPPLLAPELTGSGAGEADAVRAACAAAVRDLLATAPPALVMVGTGTRTRRHHDGAWGTLAGFGVAVEAPTGRPGRPFRRPSPELPLSLTVGCRLLDLLGGVPGAAGAADPSCYEVAVDEPPEACRQLGAELAIRHPDAGWIVLGDGTTCRTDRAPGAFDPRAESFDRAVEVGLASGEPERLVSLDAGLAADLGAVGRCVWQVLAGAWQRLGDGTKACAEIDYHDAPFGVAYLVARWSSRPGPA